MQPENNETNEVFQYAADLFAEPRDHANQWDVSGIWLDEEGHVEEPAPRQVSE